MSILQALDSYYGRMAARGEAGAQGYSREKISFAVVLAWTGEPIRVLDLRDRRGKEPRPTIRDVPAAVKRTTGVQPNLFWDKTAYALGRTARKGRWTTDQHAKFRKDHLVLLADTVDPGLVALRRFLDQWTPERFDGPPFSVEMIDTNIIFALEGENGFLHERAAARRILDARIAGEGTLGFCLVSGTQAPLCRLHPAIKGVDGAQGSGAALISFNLNAFESQGKQQGENAPISEAAARRYGAALNRLLDRGVSRNRTRIGDATVTFWADVSGAVNEVAAIAAEDFFAHLVAPDSGPRADQDCGETTKTLTALAQTSADQPIVELGLMRATCFHVLGLAPNAARLSVRFWLDDRLDAFAARLSRHHHDLAIVPSPWGTRPPSIQRLLVRTTAPLEKIENIPPLLACEVTRAVLGGARYPRTLLIAAITRLRAGADPALGWHAAIIKAVINRSEEEPVPVALEPNNPNPAYQLGRLFAVLEAAQRVALGRVNATIVDSYFGVASATPARIFGVLLRGMCNHVTRARRRGRGGWLEPKLQEVMAKLPPELPRTLRIEDQGRFVIGYYHERATRPPRSDDGIEHR